MRYLLGFSLLMTCCVVGYVPAFPEQDRALYIVWRGELGQTAEPPAIEWHTDDCGWRWPDHTVVYCVNDGTGEYGGRFYKPTFTIAVGEPTPGHSFSSQDFAHELMHAAQWLRGVDDPNHTLPEWQR